MKSYHGTSSTIAARIAQGNVNVTLGGGELGQGFYTGEHLYLAKAWALQVHKDKTKNVVEFETPDKVVESMDIEILDHGMASLKKVEIRRLNLTRGYKFGVDMVWAPIVGKEKISGDQYKWESKISENFLNNSNCQRSII